MPVNQGDGGAMSFAKRVLFGNNPRDDLLREERATQARAAVDAYQYRIGTRRKNRFADSPRWDPAWASCLTEAADELKIPYRSINSQIGFLSEGDSNAVRVRAEELHQKQVAEFRELMKR